VLKQSYTTCSWGSVAHKVLRSGTLWCPAHYKEALLQQSAVHSTDCVSSAGTPNHHLLQLLSAWFAGYPLYANHAAICCNCLVVVCLPCLLPSSDACAQPHLRPPGDFVGVNVSDPSALPALNWYNENATSLVRTPSNLSQGSSDLSCHGAGGHTCSPPHSHMIC